ncbi:Pentatricopeptide repeat-containing protein [Nymphaea thermarum]|nr:Pentatricopeptide repeat-containing protein [Nymphaea thermarum]
MAAQVAETVATPAAEAALVVAKQSLHRLLFKEGSSSRSVGRVLSRWLKDTKQLSKGEVGTSVRLLRKRKKFSLALKLLETASKRGMDLTASDEAIKIDLLSKIKGIVVAEKYFTDLPEPSKNHQSYGALFNCYCNEKMTEKAETLMEKMKEQKFVFNPLAFNSLMALYSKGGKFEKVPAVIQDMKANKVMLDVFSYNVWMRSLAALGDIPGVEKVLDEMKGDDSVTSDWTTYSNIASIYVNAGLKEKAEDALKELESKIDVHRLPAFHFLISLYGRTGNLTEVYRVWRSLKLACPKTVNLNYLIMIQTLVNLGDIPGAEKCFKEWEADCPKYDVRLPNVLIGAYAKGGEIEKAEAVREQAVSRGAVLNTTTWEIFSNYYFATKQFNISVKCMENAIAATGKRDRNKWTPAQETVESIMTHFEEQRDVDAAENLVQILKKVGSLNSAVYESLIRTYVAAGKKSPDMRQRLETDNLKVNPETEKMLESIST